VDARAAIQQYNVGLAASPGDLLLAVMDCGF